MSILSGLRERIRDRTAAAVAVLLQSVSPGLRILYPPNGEAQVRVTEANALTFAAVWACVNTISRALAPLPWRVHRRIGPEDSEIADQNAIDYLLHCRPNEETSAYVFRETLLHDALLWGNGLAEIERDRADRILALWPIPPELFLGCDRIDGRLVYRFSGVDRPVESRDVFHLRGPGNATLGYSVVRLAARSIGLGMAQERFGATFFANGARPSITVEVPGPLTPEKRTNMEEAIAAGYGGKNAGRPMVLTHGAKTSTLTMPLADAQFLESRTFQIREIARWFGVPPHKLGDLADATFANVEQMEQAFNADALTPWVARLEQEANYKLLGGSQRSRALWTKINLTARLRGDSASRSAFYSQLFQMGVLSPNDIRRLEELPGVGPDGDKRLVQTNLTTLEMIGEEPSPPAGGAGPAAAPVNPASDPSADPSSDTPTAAAPPVDFREAALLILEEIGDRIARREQARLEQAEARSKGSEAAFSEAVAKFTAEHQEYIRRAVGRGTAAAAMILGREWDPMLAVRFAEQAIVPVNHAEPSESRRLNDRVEWIGRTLLDLVEALPRRISEGA